MAAAPGNLIARQTISTAVARNGGEFAQRGAMAVGSLFTLLVFAPLAIAAARLMWRRASRGPEPQSQSNDTTQRLMRLETAVDTIAIEVERIAEGQRFVTRLISEANAVPRFEAPQTARAEPLVAATMRDG